MNQGVLHNVHEQVHAIKFQSVATPDGLVAILNSPFENRRHENGMLRESGLSESLEQYSVSSEGRFMCIYGDLAYPIRPQLQAPFRQANLTEEQQIWNQKMSNVRVSV